MDEFFRFLLRHRHYIELSDAPRVDGWCLAFSHGRGPRRTGFAYKVSGRSLHLSVHLPQTEELPSPLGRWLCHLLGQLPAEDGYPLIRRVDELWHGWESIVAELTRRNSHLPSTKNWLMVPQFELAPLEDNAHAAMSAAHSGRVHRRLDALLRLRRDDLIAVLETEYAEIQPGDLVVLKLLDETLLAAVVRWVKASIQETKIRVGLDLFGEGVECVQVLIVGQGPICPRAILAVQDGNKVLVLPPHRLKPGSSAIIGGGEAQIARLLEWTDDFCAYCLSDPLRR